MLRLKKWEALLKLHLFSLSHRRKDGLINAHAFRMYFFKRKGWKWVWHSRFRAAKAEPTPHLYSYLHIIASMSSDMSSVILAAIFIFLFARKSLFASVIPLAVNHGLWYVILIIPTNVGMDCFPFFSPKIVLAVTLYTHHSFSSSSTKIAPSMHFFESNLGLPWWCPSQLSQSERLRTPRSDHQSITQPTQRDTAPIQYN